MNRPAGMTRRHIAFVSEHASPLAVLGDVDAGGQNVHVAALSLSLALRGHRVDVYTRREEESVPERVPLGPGVVVQHVAAGPARPLPKDELLPHMDSFGEQLRQAWTKKPPDIVHAHFWMSGLAALRAAQPLRLPVAQTFHALGTVKRRHQGAMDTSPPERIDVERWIAREAAGVIATCDDEVGELAVMGAPVERVTVVPCGVDPGQFSPRGAAAPKPTTDTRLLSLGRLVPRKGVDDVLVALAGLPRAELVVAGGPEAAKLSSDPEYRRLAAVAERLGVRDRVRFLGQVRRDQVPPLLRSSDIVVCTPWYEPFGIVPLEAMACGVPVVATAVGGMLDTVVPGVTGRLVPARRPDLLRDTLARLIADPRTRQRMGRAGEERVRTLYSWERVAARTADVYDRLIEQHAVRKVDRRETAGRVA